MARLPFSRAWLEKAYLEGVDPTNDEKIAFSNALYQQAIRAAEAGFRRATHLALLPEDVEERHDAEYAQILAHGFLKTDRLPLHPESHVDLSLMFGNVVVWTLPRSWIVKMLPEAGQVQVLPVAMGEADLPMTALGRWIGTFNIGPGVTPGWYRLRYTVGFPVGELAPVHLAMEEATRVYRKHYLDDTGDPALHLAIDHAARIEAHGGRRNYDGETLAELREQAIALRRAYEVHRASETAHTAADAINVLTAPEPAEGDLSGTVRLINDELQILGAHLETVGDVHGQPDAQELKDSRVYDDYVKLPSDIVDVLAKMGCAYYLHPAGDMIAGAGIATKSKGVDGLSVSVGTTASATNSGYGSRWLNLSRDIKEGLRRIRNWYWGMRIEG